MGHITYFEQFINYYTPGDFCVSGILTMFYN